MAVVLYFDRQMKLYRNFEIAEKIKKGQHSLNSSTDFILQQVTNDAYIYLMLENNIEMFQQINS